MATNYKRPGDVEKYTNGGSAISSGDVVVLGTRIGVAQGDIATGESGSVLMKGVFTLPKVTAAVVAVGETLTWDVSAGKFDDDQATPAAGDITGAAAVAVSAGSGSDTTLDVYLTGVPGTVN
jgi:predicted RecA/RadA family phage recombinase